jgi:2-hydroxychromene-2-carboxylate isomerase
VAISQIEVACGIGKMPALTQQTESAFVDSHQTNQADHIRGSLGFPDVIGGEETFFGKLREEGAGFAGGRLFP